MTKAEASVNALKKWRELRRDLLYMVYGDEWAKHDIRAGKFWDGPMQEEKDELTLLAAISDGAFHAGDLLHGD
jgi:hypothetical protein